MRKRLRKKKRLAEFTELGFAVAVRFTGSLEDPAIGAASWAIITDCLEPAGLGFGGGGRDDWEIGFVSRRKGCTDADRETVRSYLAACPVVAAFVIGPLVDTWHRSWRDIDREYDDLQAQIARAAIPADGPIKGGLDPMGVGTTEEGTNGQD